MKDNGWAPTVGRGRQKKGAWTKKKIRRVREARERERNPERPRRERELGVVARSAEAMYRQP